MNPVPPAPASSAKSFTLQWTAEAGEHSYGVKFFEVVGEQELQVDSESGSISISEKNEIKGVEILNVDCPPRAGLGETIECKIYLKNTLNERVGINTKEVILTGHPYNEYLHETRTVSIEYPIQNSINIDPNHTEVLLVAPIEIPEDKKLLDYRYIHDPAIGSYSFDWTDTVYTLTIQIDMPYPQEDATITKTITLYYFGSPLMKKESEKIGKELLIGGGVGLTTALIAASLGLGPVGAAIVGVIVTFIVVDLSIRG
ncbi:MAG: hypothetical protein PWQ79_153 [Thermococcaceae archaeon]|nr:hypothetical protein [Thermococcaceae archaeon]